jgi:hypothetical protein
MGGKRTGRTLECKTRLCGIDAILERSEYAIVCAIYAKDASIGLIVIPLV